MIGFDELRAVIAAVIDRPRGTPRVPAPTQAVPYWEEKSKTWVAACPVTGVKSWGRSPDEAINAAIAAGAIRELA